jgi:hypothetical protein
MTDLKQVSYNKLEQLPLIPSSIISYLITNNEEAWKLLYYNSADAWSKSNLTRQQKGLIVYDGVRRVEDCRVFLDTGADSAIVEQVSFLRIGVLDYIPVNHVIGHVSVGIECYSHYLINTMNNYQTRIDAIMHSVIETLNGADIPNMARLFFDSSFNVRSKMTTIGFSPFKGKLAVMCSWSR